jgi:glycosyltransferase involved in cell wall biosynthesis
MDKYTPTHRQYAGAKITIGITTYNRLDLLKITASSLYNSNLGVPHNIRIYDDCSNQYTISELKDIFPTAGSIKRNKQNIKADRNIFQMYKDFLSTSDNYFFNADSDLIFHPQWLVKSLKLLPETSGILSIFNSNNHKPLKIINETFCIKESIGAAGTLFARNRVEEFMKYFTSYEAGETFDFQWSKYFRDRETPIYCTNKSLVQHIGYSGQNSMFVFDYGRNFTVESADNGQIINDVFEAYLDEMRSLYDKDKEKRQQEKNSLLYHIKRCFIIIIKRMLPGKAVDKILRMKNQCGNNRRLK